MARTKDDEPKEPAAKTVYNVFDSNGKLFRTVDSKEKAELIAETIDGKVK